MSGGRPAVLVIEAGTSRLLALPLPGPGEAIAPRLLDLRGHEDRLRVVRPCFSTRPER
ncbi:MAG: hypothetical protein NUW06_04835 [Candidatus Acetothermia bacterium]|jgi:hypothetical protein|nr:hypothetical protein [Candidatus Acetothermia bacterium]MDH7505215.1 hypothetical protein [Candidatus Acetothermia bacterium]